MPLLKVYTRPPFQQIYSRFKGAQGKLQTNQREMMRELGAQWVAIAQDEAPVGRTGRFRQGIFYRTYVKSNSLIELRTYIPEPLGTYITKGTKPHIIRAKNGRALKFLWEGGPRSTGEFTAYHFYRFVNHPGTKANPFTQRATVRWRPGAIVALRKVARQFVIDMKG